MTSPLPLPNSSSYCHVNVVIQCLLSCEQFNSALSFGNDDFSNAYLRLYTNFMMRKPVAVQNWIEKIQRQIDRKIGLGQQDATETLLLILDEFHENSKQKLDFHNVSIPKRNDTRTTMCLKKLFASHFSVVTRFFSFQLSSMLTCQKCHNISSKFETNNALVIPVRKHLSEALRTYFAVQTASGVYCEKCKMKQTHSRTTYLVGTAKYLFIILNRFTVDETRIQKNVQPISIPRTLDLGRYFQEAITRKYDLKAFVNHKGTIDHGHYNCFQKCGSQWFKCDDSKVQRVPSVDTSTAYILLYEKRPQFASRHVFPRTI